MSKAIKTILAIPLLLVVLAMVFFFFFGAPMALVLETCDLFRMRGETSATIQHASVREGGEGTVQPVIEYAYVVNGRCYTSDRFAPGWWAYHGGWTNGGREANRYSPGQRVVIHYNQSHPEMACLEYGWFKWSVGFSLGVWGMALRHRVGKSQWVRAAMSATMIWFGAGLIFLCRSILLVTQMHWYLLAFAGLLAVNLIRAYRVQDMNDEPVEDASPLPSVSPDPGPAMP